MKFAKLYETERGQVLVMRDTDDEYKPAVLFHFYVGTDSVGMARFGLSFSDDDEGNDKADAAFAKMDEATATMLAFAQMDKINKMFAGEA